MRIHWLQHVAFEGLGSISRWADENACLVAGSRLFAGDALPPISTFDLLVVMGGPMSVNDEMAHPWLKDEKRFISRAMDAGKMALGICLGAQLIASAAGARVYPNPFEEIGWFPVERTKAARQTAKALIDHCRHELADAPFVQTESEIRSRPDRFHLLDAEMNRLLDYFYSSHERAISKG